MCNANQNSELKYVNALLKNDSALLTEMYQKFFPGIKRMVLQNKGSEPDTNDVYQEACISILCKVRTGKLLLKKGFEGYFYTVCRNIWVDYLHREKRIITETGMDINEYYSENSFENIEECMLQERRLELFYEKFAELGDRSKELVRLRLSGKSMKEVAEIMNLSYTYVRKKLCELRKSLTILVEQSPKFVLLKR